MPRKNTMRDNVTAVRSRLPQLLNLTREQIELALLYYESNVEETVDAFHRNGAFEALSGWSEMNTGRGNTSSNRKPRNINKKSSAITSPSNGILRPSQRVSNMFQTFAEGGTVVLSINGSTATTTSSVSLPSPTAETNGNVGENDHFTDPITATNDEFIEQPKPQRRKSVKSRNSSITQTHEPSPTDPQTAPAKSAPTNNKKLLTKSAKDLQRQTSTLINVELLFNNEIKSSIKRIDDIFKQLRETIKDREIELYLEMDKVKEQGVNVIHRRQQRVVELRQQIDRCDRLEPDEIDHLRTDIKHFVSERRYELGEELTSSHRFEYDQTLVESLKHFGNVLKIDRRSSVATAIPSFEPNLPTEQTISEATTPENVEMSIVDDVFLDEKSQSNRAVTNGFVNGNSTGDHPLNRHSPSKMNGYLQYDDDANYSQNANRRQSPQYFQRPRPALNYQNGNHHRPGSKQTNGRTNYPNNNETTNTSHRPPSRSIVPVRS